jgi:flagella synthesis protein FlgN
MNLSDNDIQKVTQLLSLQKSELDKLHDLLANELAILKARDLAELEKQAQEKELLLKNINQLDQAISQQSDLKSLQENSLFSEQVTEIITLLGDCKKQNEINGQIINNSQIAINRFKGMLQQSIANNSMTYDNKGKTNINLNSIGIKA